MKRLAMTLLAVWLLIVGLEELIGFSFPAQNVILSLLALAAGVLLLLGEGKPFPINNWGIFLLGVYLALLGLLQLFTIRFNNSGTPLALLALAAGILILLQR